MKAFLAAIGFSLALSAPALAETVNKGDAAIGKTLHDKSCIACHASKFGGDGSRIYTRADRKVSTQQQLSSRVKACNNNVGAGWFPEEEAHVAAYLNATYYHIK